MDGKSSWTLWNSATDSFSMLYLLILKNQKKIFMNINGFQVHLFSLFFCFWFHLHFPLPGATYTSQGTPPTVTATSSLVAVSRSLPPIVITVPPAAGPLSGMTVLGSGSCTENREKMTKLSNFNGNMLQFSYNMWTLSITEATMHVHTFHIFI